MWNESNVMQHETNLIIYVSIKDQNYVCQMSYGFWWIDDLQNQRIESW